MPLGEKILNGLRSIFGRRREEIQSAESTSVDEFIHGDSRFSMFKAGGMDRIGDHLDLGESLAARYKDAREMDQYPEISCLTGEMRVAVSTPDGQWVDYKPIEEIASSETTYDVWAYDIEKSRFVKTEAKHPRLSGEDVEVMKVPLQSGNVLRGTPDHLILTLTGWKELQNLEPADHVISLFPYQVTQQNLAKDQTTLCLSTSPSTLQVTGAPQPDGTADVYDITTDHRNFLCEGIVVHNSAFDLMADDATVPNSMTGKSVWVDSDDDKIKKIGNDLFDKQLVIDNDIWGMARSLVKMGNLFQELIVSEDKGVLALNHLPPETIRRIETPKGLLLGFVQNIRGDFNFGAKQLVDYLNRDQDTPPGVAVFEDWQVVHWRLDAKRRRASYGVGEAEAARWIWKRLVLMEDSVIVYRLTRAPSRYAIFVDVGDLSPKRARKAMEKVRNQLRKKKFVNPRTGNLDMRYNPLCLHPDTRIPLLNGEEKTVKEMAEAFERGEEQWVYSTDLDDGGKVVPGEVVWAGKTREDAELVKITLDNGEVLKVTPDHDMIRRSGEKVEAQDLTPGDSLMPFRMYENRSGTSQALDERVRCPKQVALSENHKVVSVERIEERVDTYTLSVGPAHTFAVSAGVFICNSWDEDFIIPVRAGREAARIDQLTGMNIQDMESVEYFLKKLYVALGVPRQFLQFDEFRDAGAVLSTVDIRFARKILRIQRELRNGLKKVMRVHLAAKNIDPFSADFEVFMTVPSAIFELAQMEVRNARADLASRMSQFVSEEWLLSRVFQFSDDEIATIREQQKKEAEQEAALDQIRRGQSGGGGGGFALSSTQPKRSMTSRELTEANKKLDSLLERDRILKNRLDTLQSLLRDFKRTTLTMSRNGKANSGFTRHCG